MVAHRDKVRQGNGSNLTYPNWLKLRLEATNEPISSQELVKEYEIKTGRNISKQSATEALRKVGFGSLERRERLYWYPIEKKSGKSDWLGSKSGTPPMQTHTSHNYRFAIGYRGNQPKDGKIRPWGRTRSQYQVEYQLGKDAKLQIFKNRIVIMLSNPKGETTQEQLIEARKLALGSIIGFCKERRLTIDGEALEKTVNSHHVLEIGNADTPRTSTNLNGYLFDTTRSFSQELFDIVGSRFDNSHPGRLEHDNISKNYAATPEQRAKNTEWLLAGFRDDFALLCALNADYARNSASHVELIKEIIKLIKELREVKR
jgi:hypothetical protein